MKEQNLKRLRSQFISTVGHLLADEGVRHWQGEAAAHITAPKDRIICLNSSGVVQDLCLHAFDPGKVANTVDLTRLKLNWGYQWPARVRELRPTARGMKLELTCRASDLMELVPTVADLMLGRAEFHRDYLWDYRATEGLLPETQEWFRRLGFLRALPTPEATNTVAKLLTVARPGGFRDRGR